MERTLPARPIGASTILDREPAEAEARTAGTATVAPPRSDPERSPPRRRSTQRRNTKPNTSAQPTGGPPPAAAAAPPMLMAPGATDPAANSPGASRSPVPGAEAAGSAAAAIPYAAATMQTLAAMAAQYGPMSPVDISLPFALDGIPTGPVFWTGGESAAAYLDQMTTFSRRTEAMAQLNTELRDLLADSGAETDGGRAVTEAIIAEVNTALAALGPIQNTPTGRAMIDDVLTQALDRAGIMLGHGQSSATDTGAKLAALIDRYQESVAEPVAGGGGPGPNGPLWSGAVEDFVRSMVGTPYQMGGFSGSSIDCSGAVSAIVNAYMGVDPWQERMSTMTEGQWLADRGAQPGYGGPGDLRIGWYDRGGGAFGHTALTMPDGTHVESGGGKGFVAGSAAAGANHPMFDRHMYIPGELLRGGAGMRS